MATNNNGHLLDSSGQVVVDFVWGNLPIQPNDQRSSSNRLDITLDNHINTESGWQGYPLFTPNSTGADIIGSTDYVLVPSVLGITTASATDALQDVSLVVTAAGGATNTPISITAAARTAGSATATVTATGAGAAFPVGTSITIAGLADATTTELNGTWTVTATATNTVSFVSNNTTVIAVASPTGTPTVKGTSGTIKTQSIAAAATTIVPNSAITITPWA